MSQQSATLVAVPELQLVGDPGLFAQHCQAGELYEQQAKAPSTRKSYRSDWNVFQRYGDLIGYPIPDPDDLVEPIPVAIVYGYIGFSGTLRVPATISRHVSAIRWFHHQQQLLSPTDHPRIRDALAGQARTTSYEKRQAAPIFYDDLALILQSMDGEDLTSIRNRALLTTGFWAALRRSELVGLEHRDLQAHPGGIMLRLRRSKTDQTGVGRDVPLHRHAPGVDPVTHLQAWTMASGLTSGPVFCGVSRWGVSSGIALDTQLISVIVKAAVQSIGLDPTRYSGHSLRAGFVSECDRRRISNSAVRLTTGHTTDSMLNSYQRPGDIFDAAAGAFFDDTA